MTCKGAWVNLGLVFQRVAVEAGWLAVGKGTGAGFPAARREPSGWG